MKKTVEVLACPKCGGSAVEIAARVETCELFIRCTKKCAPAELLAHVLIEFVVKCGQQQQEGTLQ